MKPNINTALVETLIADQFPQWSGLRVREVLPNGWDNRTFRLGDEMSIRLPSAERYVAQVEKEQRWLPVLARQLPLAIPTPLETGEPSDDYPWRWSVYSWIEGETAVADRIKDMPEFARDLSGFLSALHGIDTTGAPSAGQHNFYRGGALSVYDGETRRAIEISKQNSDLDTEAFTDIWDIALSSTWQDLPVWIHGDVSSGNLLVRDGELSAVIDFGGLAVGDPACDLSIAWTMFDDASRRAYRERLDLDDATWARARGWTLWKALIIISGISDSNAAEAKTSLRTVERILLDHLRNG